MTNHYIGTCEWIFADVVRMRGSSEIRMMEHIISWINF